MPNGTIGLKAYYLPGSSHSPSSALKMWDVDYTPLRNLVASLDPALVEPMDLLLSYFEGLEDDYKPRIEIISMDCVKDSENRLKVRSLRISGLLDILILFLRFIAVPQEAPHGQMPPALLLSEAALAHRKWTKRWGIWNDCGITSFPMRARTTTATSMSLPQFKRRSPRRMPMESH